MIQRNRLTQMIDNEFIYYITDQSAAVQRVVLPAMSASAAMSTPRI
jgi:hypothetical protein